VYDIIRADHEVFSAIKGKTPRQLVLIVGATIRRLSNII
jgi:hypothetical protein